MRARSTRAFAIVAVLAGCGHKAAPDAHVDKPDRSDKVATVDKPDKSGTFDPEEYDEADGETEIGNEGDDTIDPTGGADTHGERQVLARALGTLGNMRTSTYSHTTKIDASRGQYELDCSGLVDYVLAGANPHAFEELRTATVKRPLARHFVSFFQSLGSKDSAWLPIARVDELVPGDILAWLKPADVTSRNTGHVMIVREKPHPDAKRSDMWVVPIIDSTSVPHGKSDSRKQSKATGLGTGEVLLIVDGNGKPTGYRWSRGKKAKVHDTTIAFARVR